jgi:hypothetical protein
VCVVTGGQLGSLTSDNLTDMGIDDSTMRFVLLREIEDLVRLNLSSRECTCKCKLLLVPQLGGRRDSSDYGDIAI